MAAVCAYCDRFQLGEFTGTVFCNEDCEAAYTRIRAAAEAETVAAIVAMVKDARDSCVFAVRTKDNTRERDGAVDALNGILRKIARGDHAKGGG